MMMNKTALFTAISAVFLSQFAFAGQDYFEARSDAMGGTGVAASNIEGAAFANPALLSLPSMRDQGVTLLLPTLGLDAADKDDMIDKIDLLQDDYDALQTAIDNANPTAVDTYRNALVSDLVSLQDNNAYLSGGIGLSVSMPSKGMSWGLLYKTYIDGFGIADISDEDIVLLSTLDPVNPPEIGDLTSQGRVIAGAISDIGVAVSMPLSIVNMPVTVGVTPKIQRLDSFNYGVSANNFDEGDFDGSDYSNDETGFNLDVGIAIEPMHGMVIGLAGRNLIKRELDTVESEGIQATYRVGPTVTVGVAYQWDGFTVTTDLDLLENEKFVGLEGTQYWRVGGEYQAMDWLALRLGYRHDLNDVTANLYSLGTGFVIGKSFKLDLSGMFGNDNAYGAALQTSYHF
ncbi:conjugal transfer protein TraF [Shewanella cyperi]|uniref:Conjugal transfer protein TraF n=1 Tax=Shewanella cyperi TaxID=2814292 RepID=A0A974XJK3_9GAMM|nr:conjugal transfer protein TraF [Shewanella cyperi]QSX29615.1 conjugal transfer protein TraF [Shewanella cyperi]